MIDIKIKDVVITNDDVISAPRDVRDSVEYLVQATKETEKKEPKTDNKE